MLVLALSLAVSAAPPSARLTYEQKCLYCHSEEVTERKHLSESQWRRLIETMRKKAPLLITRSDVARVAHYMVETLGLGAPEPKKPAKPKEPEKPRELPLSPPPLETAVVEPKAPEVKVEEGLPEPDLAQQALEQQGFELMQQRCARCHTLNRVYSKLDSFERSWAVVERMSLKTGSGITEADLELIREYLRGQF